MLAVLVAACSPLADSSPQCTYTALIVIINIVAVSDTNLINPADGTIQFTPDVVEARSYGSKMVVASEQMQLITVRGPLRRLLYAY